LRCSLLGWPRVSFTGSAAAVTRWRVKRIERLPVPPDVMTDPPGSLRALAPGKSAQLSMFWSNWCGPGSQTTGDPGRPPAGIRIRLAGGTSVVAPLAQAPRCDSPHDPSILSIRPFAPTWRALPQRSRLPLAVAILDRRGIPVKKGRRVRVHRGELLRFRVAVTNTARSSFRFPRTSCPSYVEQLVPGRPRAYVLNCIAVRSIGPHGTVLFAMQLPIAADARLGNAGLTWELAPKTYAAPVASAAVQVVR
jgi:hypothetical protein